MSFNCDNQFDAPQKCDGRRFEELDRLVKKHREERKLRLTAKAIAVGFSSWEEYDDHNKQRSRRIHAGFLEKLTELGITEEEWYRNHPQRWTPKISHYCLPSRIQCDCLEHPIPSFCDQTLVDHRSRDEPDLIEAQEHQQRQLIGDIKILPGDVSRRMPQEILERYWDTKSPEMSMELAPWFKGDETLQRIIDASSRSKTECLSEPARDIQPSTHVFKNQELEIKNKGKPELRSKRTGEILRKRVRGTSQQSPRTSNVFKPQSPRASRALERRLRKTAGIRKNALQPVMRTRSCNIIKFYELDSDGVARSYQTFYKP